MSRRLHALPVATAGRFRSLRRLLGRHRGAVTAAGALLVAGVLVVVLAGNLDRFMVTFGSAPFWILLVAAALHLIWLLARSEAWAVCVGAAGGHVDRRRLYRAASVGYLGNLFNPQFGLAVRIAALRRSAPVDSPPASVLVAAELPIVIIEAALAALMSFTLVGPLGVPWWAPLIALALMSGVLTLTQRLARNRRAGPWRGLAVMRGLRGRSRIIALVVLAVSIQVARNWFVLHAIGVDVSLFDSVALLIGMAAIGLLPVGPSVGAAAAVLILGANGAAVTAAAGALLTATAVAGAAAFAVWAALDRLRPPDPVLAAVPTPP